MGGITFRYGGVDWIQGDAVMVDTGCDIMLITLTMVLGMRLPIVASNTKVHTSISGQSSVLGEIADTVDVIICKGTKDELISTRRKRDEDQSHGRSRQQHLCGLTLPKVPSRMRRL
jgi:hypothetical protein